MSSEHWGHACYLIAVAIVLACWAGWLAWGWAALAVLLLLLGWYLTHRREEGSGVGQALENITDLIDLADLDLD